MKISVIVATYNWPSALRLSLQSLMRQTAHNFEIVVADDGSRNETRELIESLAKYSPVPIIHSWQEDIGFRLARSRNQAVLKSHGDYLIFVDGDCIVPKDFVANHLKLAASGKVVAGPRILLTKPYSMDLQNKSVVPWSNFDHAGGALRLWLRGCSNRWMQAISLPIGGLRDLIAPLRWKHLRGCNWALYKSDFLSVNGLDESFEGWGQEDSDMVIRLINNEVHLRTGCYGGIPVFHLWHRQVTREGEHEKKALLMERLEKKIVRPIKGIY